MNMITRFFKKGKIHNYNMGFQAGVTSGYRTGFQEGYDEGKKDGLRSGYKVIADMMGEDSTIPTVSDVLEAIG